MVYTCQIERMPAAKKKRPQSQIDAEAAHLQSLKDQGLYTQINMRVKTPERMAVLKKLRKRFPDMADPAIGWLAMEELAAKRNK